MLEDDVILQGCAEKTLLGYIGFARHFPDVLAFVVVAFERMVEVFHLLDLFDQCSFPFPCYFCRPPSSRSVYHGIRLLHAKLEHISQISWNDRFTKRIRHRLLHINSLLKWTFNIHPFSIKLILWIKRRWKIDEIHHSCELEWTKKKKKNFRCNEDTIWGFGKRAKYENQERSWGWWASFLIATSKHLEKHPA